jgi:hypothetical protein
MNVPCFTHDRGQDLQHYGLFENSTQLDLTYVEQDMEKVWNRESDERRRREIAEKFYLDRSKGVLQNWYTYTDAQRAGQLPAGWDPTKRNIAIYNSSEDEFEAVGDQWINPLYASQQEGLERIIQSLSRSAHNVHLYLRIHPNLKGIDNAQTRQLATLRSSFLTVIPPEDPVCTYTLMKQADKVVTFGSTTGIEAVFWGVPSVLAGPAFYRKLGGTYNPRSHEELVTLLLADLPPKDTSAALIYGYYFNAYGVPFKHYEALGMREGTFKGQQLSAKRRGWWILGSALESIWGVRHVARMLFILRTRQRVTGGVPLRILDTLPTRPRELWRRFVHSLSRSA